MFVKYPTFLEKLESGEYYIVLRSQGSGQAAPADGDTLRLRLRGRDLW